MEGEGGREGGRERERERCIFEENRKKEIPYSTNIPWATNFADFVKILILRKIKFTDCKHNL